MWQGWGGLSDHLENFEESKMMPSTGFIRECNFFNRVSVSHVQVHVHVRAIKQSRCQYIKKWYGIISKLQISSCITFFNFPT